MSARRSDGSRTAVKPDVSDSGAGEGPVGTGLFHVLVEQVASRYGEGPYRDEVARARDEYFARAGKVFEDDGDLYDRRMASFLEWYLIERPLQGGSPPIVRALEESLARTDDPPSDEERANRRALAALASSHRSLFDITAVVDRTIQVEDIIAGGRFEVVERRSTIGFEVGEILEARLISDGDIVVFGKTLLFHPRDAREQVLGAIDAGIARGEAREAVVFMLSRLHVRWHRLGHVAAARVYREGLVRSPS